ncbi:DUF4286 family protein [Mangrovivirga cuniculi]|uniref:DUF4286 domain-containing protein n=1 Tax=Mangrovivirga cuniculi TaxID=2715131 RepID=A0A4D7JJG2_9BACT|nr:DUF4286 family protein [Mangrovivirga cuniculi]QCK13560.1 DUF4286 domain-containing protein [Mangrovivirga cuniculi]
MVLYSVTVNVDKDIEEEWLDWMKTSHIPKVLNTGMFKEYKMFRLLNEESGVEGTTFSIQYFAEDINKINEYLENHAPDLINEHYEKYKDRHVSFRTLLEQIV